MQSSFIRTTFVVLGLVFVFAFVPLSNGLAPEAAAQGVEESVTGHVQFVNPNNQNDVRYSVSAIRRSDGTVSGEVEAHLITPSGDVTIGHGTVICLSLVGNKARIGGIVDRIEPPSPFTNFRLTVIDNGEGGNAPADEASPIILGSAGTAQAHCNGAFEPNRFPVERGNIQIRPSGL